MRAGMEMISRFQEGTKKEKLEKIKMQTSGEMRKRDVRFGTDTNLHCSSLI